MRANRNLIDLVVVEKNWLEKGGLLTRIRTQIFQNRAKSPLDARRLGSRDNQIQISTPEATNPGRIPMCLFHAKQPMQAAIVAAPQYVSGMRTACAKERNWLSKSSFINNLKTQFLTVHLSLPLLTPTSPIPNSTTRQPQPCYTHSTSSTTGEPGKFLHFQPSLPSNTPPAHASKTSAPPKSPAYQNTTSPRSIPPNAPS